MKRLIIILALVLTASAWAQSTDTTRTTPAAGGELDGGTRRATTLKNNVLGAPVYYDTLGNVRGTTPHSDAPRLPRHHYFNRLSNDYCSYFLEVKSMIGHDLAFGASFTYLPERWGFYGSALAGLRRPYFAAGPTLRLSDYGGSLDWQLYGGLVVSRHLGAEAGIRMALPKRSGSFSWESVSMGTTFVNGHFFFTCGLSLEFMAVTVLSFLWW